MAKKEETAQGGRDVEVTPGKPLNITDEDRNFGKVTIYPGGQIFINTIAPVSIQYLIKKTS